ncbi:hypothetical protein ELI_2100 [Eubacterium callanderi]|uniref:Uncharacterized protein n=1 Tax=Eubacterium callanderi TaxID=53442 RepID=E3GMM0_9FIRM|nr:hypothetical protein ELI_2100 [Eubacterium callanderi]MCQ5188541.1 hypothetical protein [Eubacterium callanderi]
MAYKSRRCAPVLRATPAAVRPSQNPDGFFYTSGQPGDAGRFSSY